MIVADTSFVYALVDGRDGRHAEAAAWYRRDEPALATTPLALAEIDHLLTARAGSRAVAGFRHDLAAGAYGVEWWDAAARESVDVATTYAQIGLDLTDASLVVLAARLGTTRIATFDERHFRRVRPLSGRPAFVLLPSDAGAPT